MYQPPLPFGAHPRRHARAMWFDGDDRVSRNEANFRTSDTTGTIMAWLLVAQPATTGNHTIFTANIATDATKCYLRMLSNNISWALRLSVAGTDGIQSSINSPVNSLPVNHWTHCAVTSDGSAWQMYLNGALVAVTVTEGSNTGQWFSSIVGATIIQIGQEASFRKFWGVVYDVCVYARALSAAEIQAAMFAPVSGLVLRLRGSGVTDADWQDLSGEGHDCTVSGSPDVCMVHRRGIVIKNGVRIN